MLHNLHPVPFTFNARKHGVCVEVRQNNLGYLDLVLLGQIQEREFSH